MVASVSFGRVAQLVEHLTFNQVAPGSNPGALTNTNSRLRNACFFFSFQAFWQFECCDFKNCILGEFYELV